MAKSKVLDLAREVGMEDDKLLLKLKRMGVKVREKKPTEPEKPSLFDEKIIEKEVFVRKVKPTVIRRRTRGLELKVVKVEALPPQPIVVKPAIEKKISKLKEEKPEPEVKLKEEAAKKEKRIERDKQWYREHCLKLERYLKKAQNANTEESCTGVIIKFHVVLCNVFKEYISRTNKIRNSAKRNLEDESLFKIIEILKNNKLIPEIEANSLQHYKDLRNIEAHQENSPTLPEEVINFVLVGSRVFLYLVAQDTVLDDPVESESLRAKATELTRADLDAHRAWSKVFLDSHRE